jgi:ribonucleotide reductase beta subunit family protein with ferritin-like domain
VSVSGGDCHAVGYSVEAEILAKNPPPIPPEYPEYPDWIIPFPTYFQRQAEDYLVREQIVDWMINGIQEEGLNAVTLKEFVKNRINNSMEQIGFPQVFEVDKGILSTTMWFEEELLGNNMTDFFKSKPTEYSKKSQSFDEDDLF